MPPTTVWLVRHALAEGNSGRCCGRSDIPLAPEGLRQARAIAEKLSRESIAQVYASQLRRAVETARILAEPHGVSVRTMEELAEIDFGDLEGLTFEEIERRYPDAFRSWMTEPTQTQFPNGESFSQMRARVLGALKALLARHKNESIAVVTHAGVIRLLLGEALQIPENQIFRLAQRDGAINRIDYFDHGAMVQLVNGGACSAQDK